MRSRTLLILLALLLAVCAGAAAEAPGTEEAADADVLGVWYLHRAETDSLVIPAEGFGAPVSLVFGEQTVTWREGGTDLWTAPWSRTGEDALTVLRSFGGMNVVLVHGTDAPDELRASETAYGIDADLVFRREPLPEETPVPTGREGFDGAWTLVSVDGRDPAALEFPTEGSLTVGADAIVLRVYGTELRYADPLYDGGEPFGSLRARDERTAVLLVRTSADRLTLVLSMDGGSYRSMCYEFVRQTDD